MFTRFKKDGAKSTAGASGKRGHKGRLELIANCTEDGNFSLRFYDIGGFGKTRWEGDFGTLTKSDLEDMATELLALAGGEIVTTALDEEILDRMIADAIAEAKSQPAATEVEPVVESSTDDDGELESHFEAVEFAESDDPMDELTA